MTRMLLTRFGHRSWLATKSFLKRRKARPSRPRRWALAGCGALALLVPALGLAIFQLPYDTEYPMIGYWTSTPTDPIAQLQEKINSGDVHLQFETKSGYLDSVLRELRIPVASQTLVFTKTSLMVEFISPEKPRAIYFNDDVYVAWEQGGPTLEISSVDPRVGPIFYTLDQQERGRPSFRRQSFRCLRCHDSFSLTGGGVPRHILGSGLPDPTGQLASHEGWHLTNYKTPLDDRWGGWYVTGSHGDQLHMGNLILETTDQAANIDFTAGANLTDLSPLVDTAPYLSQHSDIVALLVMEHQVSLQNLITRVNYDSRRALFEQQIQIQEQAAGEDASDAAKQVEAIAEPLVEAILMVGEAPLEGAISGTSGFAEEFVSLGPRDSRGRSLRELDLVQRLFRYPCSYLIYSEAFEALPQATKAVIFRRLQEVLDGKDQSASFAHLSETDRRAILEILKETKPDWATWLSENL